MAVKRKNKTDRKEHETPTRSKFRLLIQKGYSQRHAAEELDIKRSTAQRWLNSKQQDRRNRRKRGPQQIVSDVQVKQMIDWITGHYDRRILSLQEIAKAHNIQASTTTLRRAFARHGYHYHTPDCKPDLSATNKHKRWIFSWANWDRPKEYWRKGFYTDETTVSSAILRRQNVLRKRGERRRLDCIQFTFRSGRKSVSCWAAIGYGYKSKLYFITGGEEGSFTQQRYESEILRGPLAEIFKDKKDLGYFCVEDGSRVHGLKDTRGNKGLCNKARVECFINTIQDWPPCSPDLNPIENIWRILKQLLRNRKPHGGWSLEQLKEALINIWENEITSDYINKYIDSIPERLEKVRLRKGAQTPY